MIKRIQEFIKERNFLKKYPQFTKYGNKRDFESFTNKKYRNHWEIGDSFLYQYNKHYDCTLKIKLSNKRNKDLVLCIEDIPFGYSYDLSGLQGTLDYIPSHYQFEIPLIKKICNLFSKYFEPHFGDTIQGDDETDEDVYNKKVKEYFADIFEDYKFYSFNGFNFLKAESSDYKFNRSDYIIKSGLNLVTDYECFQKTKDLKVGFSIGYDGNISESDIEVASNRMLDIDNKLKINIAKYRSIDVDDPIYTKITFYYEFKSIEELSNFLLSKKLISL